MAIDEARKNVLAIKIPHVGAFRNSYSSNIRIITADIFDCAILDKHAFVEFGGMLLSTLLSGKELAVCKQSGRHVFPLGTKVMLNAWITR